jgi:hypothetical protein
VLSHSDGRFELGELGLGRAAAEQLHDVAAKLRKPVLGGSFKN